jgi:hypothetical protein
MKGLDKKIATVKRKKEQLAQYHQLCEEFIAEQWKAVDIIDRNYTALTDGKSNLTAEGRNTFFKLLKKYSLSDVLEAMPIACAKCMDDFSSGSWFLYMCGILRNWKRDGDNARPEPRSSAF